MKQVKRSALAAGVGSTAAFYGVMGVCSLALGAAVTMVATEPPLTCTDPGSQLFPIDIVEAFFGSRSQDADPIRPSIAGAPEGSRKLCHRYPFSNESLGSKFAKAWDGFGELATVQFILPAAAAATLSAIRLRASGGAPAFTALHQAAELQSDATGGVVVDYPPPGAERGQPVQLSLVPHTAVGGPRGDALMAVWISFAEPFRGCAGDGVAGGGVGETVRRGDGETAGGHCCNVVDDLPVLGQPGCSLGVSQWECTSLDPASAAGVHAHVGAPWKPGHPVGTVDYRGSMATTGALSAMADGRPVLIHLADTADLGSPLSNSMAVHPVADSPGCRSLCAALAQDPQLDLFKNADAASCKLAGPPAFRAARGYGPIRVEGFGRINGQKVMRRTRFGGVPVWHDPGAGALNGYGSAVGGFKTIADAESHTRWRIQSGLLELSSAANATVDRPFAVDVVQVAVAWGAKRGDGSLRLQFPRVPLLGHADGDAATNRPARLYDVKTPGTWVGASDGPRVTADGSWVGFLYLQHADDNLKIDSSFATYKEITLLQGNIGSAIELGTYGIGLRGNRVHHASAKGIHVHRISQVDGQDDSIGSLFGSRTCPWGVSFRNVTVDSVSVAALGGRNKVHALLTLGTLGPQEPRFSKISNQDRWFFCSNPWWLDGETVVTAGEAATMDLIMLSNWSVGLVPATQSLIYNFNINATTTFSRITFSDQFGIHAVPFRSNLSGAEPLFYR